MNRYRNLTTEKLITMYAEEENRVDAADASMTRHNIRMELTRRFQAVIDLLDDPQTASNPDGTYRYLLGK